MSHIHALARRMSFAGDPTAIMTINLDSAPGGRIPGARYVASNLLARDAARSRGFRVVETRPTAEEMSWLNQYVWNDEQGGDFKFQPGDNMWLVYCDQSFSELSDGTPMCGKPGAPLSPGQIPSDAQHADKPQPGTYVAIDDVRADQVRPALAYMSKDNIRGAFVPGGVPGGKGEDSMVSRAREAFRLRGQLADLHNAQMKLYRDSSAVPTNAVYTSLESSAKWLAESAQPAAVARKRLGSPNRFGVIPAVAPAAAEAPAALAITVETAAAFPWTAVVAGGIVIVVVVSVAAAIYYFFSNFNKASEEYAKAELACAESVSAALAVVQDPSATPRDKAVAQEYIDFSVKKGCAKRLKPPTSPVDYLRWGLYGLAGLSAAYLLALGTPAIFAASKESARKTKAKGQAVTQAKAQVQQISMARIEAQAKAKVQAEAKAKAQAQAKAQAESKAKAQAQVKAQAQAKAKAQAESKAKAQAQAKAKAQADLHAKAEAEAKAKADLFAKAEAQAKAEAKEHAKAKAQAQKQASPGSFNFIW